MKKTAIYYATVTGTLIRSRDRRGRLRSAESGTVLLKTVLRQKTKNYDKL